jgi:hypothetical protein
MSVKRYYGTLVLVLCIIKGFGQTIPKESSFELKTILGTHIYNDQGHLFQDKVYGLDAAYLVNIKQKNVEWVRLTNAKNYGLTFLYRDLKNLKGILIGGPMPTKDDFLKEGLLVTALKNKVIGMK